MEANLIIYLLGLPGTFPTIKLLVTSILNNSNKKIMINNTPQILLEAKVTLDLKITTWYFLKYNQKK